MKGPTRFWDDYYRTRKESPSDLMDKTLLLRSEKKFVDIEAAIRGYLRHNGREAKSWMYHLLAVAMEINGKPKTSVMQSLRYAADLAEKTEKDPNSMLLTADLLYLRGDRARAGELVDSARIASPYDTRPRVSSMALAIVDRDPKRMTAASAELLELGWPGVDEEVRRLVRKQNEALAKLLRESGRDQEASELISRLTEGEVRDLVIRLTWDGDADLDLVVSEPGGSVAKLLTPATVGGGSIVVNGIGRKPEEFYVCPRAFNGEYRIRIDTIYNNPEKRASRATVEVLFHEGGADEAKKVFHLDLKANPNPEPIVIAVKEGRRVQALAKVGPLANQEKNLEMIKRFYERSEDPKPPDSKKKNADKP